MSEAAPDFHRQMQLALTTLVGASLVLGIVNAATGMQESGALTLVASVVMLALGFRWLHFDSAELDIRRPVWLNVAIVLAAAVFVPYYLFKTRPAGRRLPAIAAFFGVVFACAFASAIGATAMAYFGGTLPTT